MRNSKTILYVAAGISVVTLGWAAIRASRSSAATREADIQPQSIVLIGDSQTARHLGEAFVNTFDDYKVNYFGKPGATHEDYLKSRELQQQIDNLPCADVVYIQLGDNGISGNTNSIAEFLNLVQQKCPNARVYWGGPMKAVQPTFQSDYVTTTNTSSPRYLPRYNETRKVWINRLRSGLEGTGVTFVDNYELQESQPESSAFSDARGGDGIHLTEDAARSLAGIVRDIVEDTFSK